MKKRISLPLGGAIVALLLVWWLWPRQLPSVADEQPTIATSQRAHERVPATASGSSVTDEDLHRTPLKGPADVVRKRIDDIRAAMNFANQPVRFYGQVIDQNDAPLPGVKVTLSVRRTIEVLPGLLHDNSDQFDVVTDTAGRFQLTDAKGALLGVKTLEKAGYESSAHSQRYFWYYENEDKKYRPDANAPEVFRMWKLAGAETLMHKGIGTRIPYDGRSVNFDLQAEREVPSGGDIRVTLTRTPLQIKRGQDKYEWTATIEAVNGGVFVSNDEFMYRAPESGYESKLVISVSAQDPKWSADKEVSFYLKSRGGYARVHAKFMTDSEKPSTGFDIEAFINPTGSRNLEYDPLQGVAKLPTPAKASVPKQ